MKYSFSGIIEKKDNQYSICIPFNVWEVCRHNEEIQADITIQNKVISCELIPEEKGNYSILFDKQDLEGITVGQEHQIQLHISGSLVNMSQNSPYSLDKPIRKIDHIDVVIQKEDGLCGQTCVAMLAGVTIEDVIEVMNCQNWQATMGRVISALNYYGIGHSDVIVYTMGKEVKLPKCSILMEKMGRYCHYLVSFDGKFYDSNLGIMTEYDTEKLQGYLEVFI